jgi:hypothetical protein
MTPTSAVHCGWRSRGAPPTHFELCPMSAESVLSLSQLACEANWFLAKQNKYSARLQ